MSAPMIAGCNQIEPVNCMSVIDLERCPLGSRALVNMLGRRRGGTSKYQLNRTSRRNDWLQNTLLHAVALADAFNMRIFYQICLFFSVSVVSL